MKSSQPFSFPPNTFSEWQQYEHVVGCVYLRRQKPFIPRLRHCSRPGSLAHGYWFFAFRSADSAGAISAVKPRRSNKNGLWYQFYRLKITNVLFRKWVRRLVKAALQRSNLFCILSVINVVSKHMASIWLEYGPLTYFQWEFCAVWICLLMRNSTAEYFVAANDLNVQRGVISKRKSCSGRSASFDIGDYAYANFIWTILVATHVGFDAAHCDSWIKNF